MSTEYKLASHIARAIEDLIDAKLDEYAERNGLDLDDIRKDLISRIEAAIS